MRSPARYIDHTLLHPDATGAAFQRLCAEALEHGFASVCVPPRFVAPVSRCLAGSTTVVGTVIGFPLGYMTSASKVFETREAVAHGASEIDMVIAVGAALEKHFDEVEEEISRVVAAAGENVGVKVIIECAYLDRGIKVALVERAVRAGAGRIGTSAGVQIMQEWLAAREQV